MSAPVDAPPQTESGVSGYVLDEQVGFILRQVQQRHGLIFAASIGEDLTPMQWAVLAKLAEIGECSQNLLGRLVAMDVATVKGVIERLTRRHLVTARPDPDDRRRLLLQLTPAGACIFENQVRGAKHVSHATLAPLTAAEAAVLILLLKRLR